MIQKINSNDLITYNQIIKNIDEHEVVTNELLEHPFYNYIKYVVNDLIVAILKYSVIYDRIEIDYIYVLPDYRHMKIGSKLVNYVIENNNENFNISLEVRASNFAAIKMYEKFQFKKLLIRKKYYGDEDAIIYMRGDMNE
ncbi:MAG: GNAT family N-acetyltransferase [Bacilli bacterium]|nr:GNAT family N-acetyltransferase [Bacilli bacterium]MDD4547399.1 GNAT family N-acetyltransferase [Bacilli bacterium]